MFISKYLKNIGDKRQGASHQRQAITDHQSKGYTLSARLAQEQSSRGTHETRGHAAINGQCGLDGCQLRSYRVSVPAMSYRNIIKTNNDSKSHELGLTVNVTFCSDFETTFFLSATPTANGVSRNMLICNAAAAAAAAAAVS